MREKPAAEIIQYILDLKKNYVALYRTKLMVVGYEKVGKTSSLSASSPSPPLATSSTTVSQ